MHAERYELHAQRPLRLNGCLFLRPTLRLYQSVGIDLSH